MWCLKMKRQRTDGQWLNKEGSWNKIKSVCALAQNVWPIIKWLMRKNTVCVFMFTKTKKVCVVLCELGRVSMWREGVPHLFQTQPVCSFVSSSLCENQTHRAHQDNLSICSKKTEREDKRQMWQGKTIERYQWDIRVIVQFVINSEKLWAVSVFHHQRVFL